MALALSKLGPGISTPDLLVGLDTADDAAVYRLDGGTALVCTVDQLAPVVADARLFGRIAAANCLSDIYAMGGEPFLALNVAAFPGRLDPAILGEILAGGQETASQAGVVVAGGHTCQSEGIMYGLCAIGRVAPDRIVTNAGARPGNVIVLTKPIGVGSIVQAAVLGEDAAIDMAPVVAAMIELNRDAARAMLAAGARAATDVTGFGLAGHLVEMAEASGVGIELHASAIPVHAAAREVFARNVMEPGIPMNLGSFGPKVEIAPGVGDGMPELIFGAETSGGLAVALPEGRVEDFRRAFGRSAPVIGRVVADHPGRLSVSK